MMTKFPSTGIAATCSKKAGNSLIEIILGNFGRKRRNDWKSGDWRFSNLAP
jgi:hypothetical protein